MNKETLRMQMLAGLITESQYKAKLKENISNSVEELAGKLRQSFPDADIKVQNIEGTDDGDMEVVINDDIFIAEGAYDAWDAMVGEEEESFQNDDELIAYLQDYLG
jgi:hypothetical protein